MTAEDLVIAAVDDMLRLVSDAKGERDPVDYLTGRLLDMRLALSR